MTAISPNFSSDHQIVDLMPAMRRFAWRFVSNENDADDLVQETVMRALAHSDQFAPGSSMKSWMFTIMRNAYCNRYKSSQREICGSNADAALIDVAVSASQDWEMRAADVNAAILLLSCGEREALMLVSSGTSYVDAARSGHCEIGTIKSRVSRARRHLADLLGEVELAAGPSTG